MKSLTVMIAAIGFAFAGLAVSTRVEAQQCLPVSNSKSTNCYRQAGATCDTTSKQWVNADKARYDACMSAKPAPANAAPAKSAPAKSPPAKSGPSSTYQTGT